MAISEVTRTWIAREVLGICADALDESEWDRRLVSDRGRGAKDIHVCFSVPPTFPRTLEQDENVFDKWRDRYLYPAGRSLAVRLRHEGIKEITLAPPLGGDADWTSVQSQERRMALRAFNPEPDVWQVDIYGDRAA